MIPTPLFPAAKPSDALWYSRSSVPTPLGIAAQLGWLQQEFAADGISVLSAQGSADSLVRQAHATHNLPNLFRQGGNVPAIWSRARGADTRIIGLTWTDEFQVLLTLRGAGILRARDLHGRRLGLPLHVDEQVEMSRATALRGYLSVLEQAGVNYRDVEFVDIPASTIGIQPVGHSEAFIDQPAGHLNDHSYIADVRALLRGEVDVIYVKGVRGVEATRLLGDRAIIAVDIGGNPDTRWRANNATPRPLTVNASMLREYPDLVVRFLHRVVDVGAWAVQHPKETLDILSRETGSRPEWVNYAYGIDLNQHLFTHIEDGEIAALDEFKNFLFQWGFIEDNFNIAEWIDPSAMFAVERALQRKRA